MVSYKVNGLKVEIKNPYAIVLLPEFNVVRYGEKEQMEIEYKKIIEKIENYIEKENQDELVKEINEILKQYEQMQEMMKRMQQYKKTGRMPPGGMGLPPGIGGGNRITNE